MNGAAPCRGHFGSNGPCGEAANIFGISHWCDFQPKIFPVSDDDDDDPAPGCGAVPMIVTAHLESGKPEDGMPSSGPISP